MKAQSWGIDLSIAIIIFTAGIIAFFLYVLNNPNQDIEILEELSNDGNIIMESLLSEGYPLEWNSENVIKIGLFQDNKIQDSKVQEFYDLCNLDYQKTKEILNTRFDYYFFLNTPLTIDAGNIEGIGKPGITSTTITSENLIKITRITNYQNKPVIAYLYIWE